MNNMKYILNILLVLFVVRGSAERLVYPELDKGLIALWENANKGDSKGSQATMQIVLTNWASVKPDILKINDAHFNNSHFVKDTETILSMMQNMLKKGGYSRLEDFVYQLLWDFSSMRNCIGIDDYPLDQLLITHLTYNEIHYTVHDEMMGLRYWFEFQEIVNDFVENWDQYDCIQTEEVQKYFPHVREKYHQVVKDKLNHCLSNFIKSLESAYRNDFEIPCDEMGDAIQELIFLYQGSIEF